MTRPNGVEQSYSFGELASHNTAVWKAAVGPGSCLAQVPVRYSGMRPPARIRATPRAERAPCADGGVCRGWVGSRQHSSTPKNAPVDRFPVSQIWTEVPEVIGRGKTQDQGDADERHGNAGDQADGTGELQRSERQQP